MGSEHKDSIEGSVTSPSPAPGAVVRAQAAHPSSSAPAAASASSLDAAAANPLKPKLTKQKSSLTTFVERRSHGLRAALLHALPMALIQACDFVSDCFVVFGEFRTHPAMLVQYTFSVFFMALSLVGAWLWIFIRLRGKRHKLIAALLAPVNLHTLYIGGLYTLAEASLPRNPNAKDLEHVESLYALFIGLKVAEAATESFNVGVMTLNAWAIGESDNDLLLFSSAVISMISLACACSANPNLSSQSYAHATFESFHLRVLNRWHVLVHLVASTVPAGAKRAQERAAATLRLPVRLHRLGFLVGSARGGGPGRWQAAAAVPRTRRRGGQASRERISLVVMPIYH